MVDVSTVASAAKWIAASLIQEGQYLYGVKDLVGELQADLECMQELLQRVDADPGLVKEDGQLRIFAHKLRELAFRAEDAIDTYVVDVGAKVYTKTFLLKLACLLAHSYPLHILRTEIEAIKNELQQAKKRFEDFGMQQNVPGSSSRRPTSNYVPIENYAHLDEVVVGIDDVVTQLAKRLTDPNDDFRVLGIVGTGGAGKSTLATQLYRHNQVSSLFPDKAFVSVSQKWSRSDLLRRIFKQIKGDNIPSSEIELVKQLHDFIKDNKCLVVLDDVWKKEAWDDVYPIFPPTNKFGYRVILTTRNAEVPLHADNKCITHEPKLLTEGQKWELFRKLAMEGRPQIEKNFDQFEKLGRRMLEECPGLPLAIVTLAGILRTKQELYEWEETSSACRAMILKGKGSSIYGVVKDMLELSYLDLPPHLKSCFLYLSIFPEDYVIPAERLIPYWVAEGFTTSDVLLNEQEILEDAGLRLLDELARRCIIQVLKRNPRGQIEAVMLHDLMRDFSVKKAEEYQFSGTFSTTNAEARGPSRRLAIQSLEKIVVENLTVRSIIECEEPNHSVSDEVTVWNSEQVGRCKLLRVLFIRTCPVPKRIGKLTHLRFLCLNIDSSHGIPKSIKNLRNLLYLGLFNYVRNEVELPNDLVFNMQNLRQLVLVFSLCPGSRCFDTSLGLKGPKNLQMLRINAGKWMMNELPTLSLTMHDIKIYDIKTTEEIDALYRCPNFVGGRLRTLECWFAEPVDTEYLEFDLQKLSNCKTLWSLQLNFCTLMGAPEFPPSLVELSLYRSKMAKWEYFNDLLQVLGELSNLKILKLAVIENCGKVLSCKAGAFPQLQRLELLYLDGLEEWVMEEGAMPHLTELIIIRCKGLKRLPQSIQSITTIKELVISYMSEEFFARLGYGASGAVGEDSHIIQHIPSVRFHNHKQATS